MVIVRPARFADALDLAGRLRFADAEEIASSWGVGAKTGLFCCLLQSDRAFAVLADDAPVALCGISDSPSTGLRIGVPWLLAADELFARRRLSRLCRNWVHQLLLEYDVLTNLTDAGNTAHRRWLAWCGFLPLRVHECHGALERPFEEFYLVNDRHDAVREPLRQFLLHRPRPPDGLTLDADARRLVDVALGLLGDSDDATARSALADLAGGLHGSNGWGARVPSRTRSACVRLVLEVARRCARSGRLPVGPLEEFYGSLVAVADVAELVPERHAIEPIVGALGAEPAAPMARWAGPAQAAASGAPGGAFEPMVRRYLYQLTDGGRWPCLHAYRVRAAGLGFDAGRRNPLGLPLHRFDRRLRDHLDGCARQSGARLSMAELARRRHALLRQPLAHGQAMTGVLGAFAAGSLLGRALDAVLDERAVSVPGGSVLRARGAAIGNVAEALGLVSALADRIALRVLPSLRLGVVVTGYSERHWLYRCLRARLLGAAACEGGSLHRLLRDDVTALLLAARFEEALLEPSRPEGDWAARLAAVANACLAPFGPDVLADDGLGHLTDLLTPVTATPVVHALQVEPALVVWHLAVSGSLTEALDDLSRRGDGGGCLDRGYYRRALRRLVRSVDVDSVERRLGSAEAES